jgi:hypothetical protein
MRTFLIALALIAALSIGAATARTAIDYTLAIDQPNPARGDSVTFTGTFPATAFRQAHNSQFHANPYLTVLCSDAGTTLYSDQTSFVKGAKLADGSVVGTSYPLTLDSPTWPAGAGADCQASSGYWTYSNADGAVYHQVAVTFFSIPATATVPGAPVQTSIIPGCGWIAYYWDPPATDGGSPITAYNIYRGYNVSGSEVFYLWLKATANGYTDGSVDLDDTYYYQISAVNIFGEGPLSNELSAAPVC